MLQTGKRRALITALAIIMAFVLASCDSGDDGTPESSTLVTTPPALSDGFVTLEDSPIAP